MPRQHSRMRRIAVAVTLVAIALGASACTADVDRPTAPEGWTILTYSIADTDLEPFMMTDLDEQGDVGSRENFNLVALVDRADGYDSDPVLGLDDWTGARVLHIGSGEADVLEEMGDVNTGDPSVLAEFVARSIAAFPAEHYGLILSDHGASWPGVGGDESAGYDILSLGEIRDGVREGLDAASVDRLDLLGFDACLMATYEVASALASVADRMLASQELEPGHGWDYSSLAAATDPAATADTLGSAIIAGYRDQAQSEDSASEITLSLVDLTAMSTVENALLAFTSALGARVESVAPVVGRTLASTLGFGRSPDPFEDSHMADLAILAGEIGVDALDVSDEADDLVRAINDAVLDRVDGQATRGATGLSIYFPASEDYFSSDYLDLDSAGGWADFLQTYYSTGSDIPTASQARFTPDTGEYFFDDFGLTITGIFELASENNLADAYIQYGIVEDDESVTYLGDEPATVSFDGSGRVTGVYDLSQLTMSDGEDTAVAYRQVYATDEPGITTVDVPMAYYAPDDVAGETYKDALLSLTIDTTEGSVLDERYYAYNETLGTYGELTTDPHGIIVPELPNVLDDGTTEWLATTDYGLYADLPNLSYSLDDLESGTVLYIELTIVDFGGNSDYIYATVTVP